MRAEAESAEKGERSQRFLLLQPTATEVVEGKKTTMMKTKRRLPSPFLFLNCSGLDSVAPL